MICVWGFGVTFEGSKVKRAVELQARTDQMSFVEVPGVNPEGAFGPEIDPVVFQGVFKIKGLFYRLLLFCQERWVCGLREQIEKRACVRECRCVMHMHSVYRCM